MNIYLLGESSFDGYFLGFIKDNEVYEPTREELASLNQSKLNMYIRLFPLDVIDEPWIHTTVEPYEVLERILFCVVHEFSEYLSTRWETPPVINKAQWVCSIEPIDPTGLGDLIKKLPLVEK